MAEFVRKWSILAVKGQGQANFLAILSGKATLHYKACLKRSVCFQENQKFYELRIGENSCKIAPKQV